MNGFYKYYKDMPPWGKAISIIGIGVAGFIVYGQISKAIKGAKDKREAQKLTKEAEAELAALRRKGVVATFTDAQFESFCLKLQEAMNGCGTNVASIMAVFEQFKNKADVLKLISQFGIRYYRPCPLVQPVSYALYLNDNTRYGGVLPTWLEYDLTSSEIQDINDILKKKKIDFTF